MAHLRVQVARKTPMAARKNTRQPPSGLAANSLLLVVAIESWQGLATRFYSKFINKP